MLQLVAQIMDPLIVENTKRISMSYVSSAVSNTIQRNCGQFCWRCVLSKYLLKEGSLQYGSEIPFPIVSTHSLCQITKAVILG